MVCFVVLGVVRLLVVFCGLTTLTWFEDCVCLIVLVELRFDCVLVVFVCVYLMIVV